MPNKVLKVWRTAAAAILTSAVLAVALASSAPAQSFSVVYSFTGGGDGGYPLAGVTVDRSGNLYCTTSAGGTSNRGAACKLTRQGSGWTYKNLYSFAAGSDASTPIARAVFGPDGTLYGATEFGGRNCGGNAGCGTVYRLQPPPGVCKTSLCFWTETILYRFSGGSDGANPGYGDVVYDASGNLYGTTFYGGINAQGVVFKLTRSGNSWTESVIHTFTGPDGINPFSGLTADSAGNFYGTTNAAGASGYGTVYELSPSGGNWTENTLYSFALASSGGNPYGGVIVDSTGNLFGATSAGGTGNGGTVYELAQSGGGWTFDLLYSFSGNTYQPGSYGNLAQDAAGNLYGTTRNDGANGVGSIFKLTPSGSGWTYTSLHDFTGGSDGGNPYGNLAFDADGNLFGTAKVGGAHGFGVVWEITP